MALGIDTCARLTPERAQKCAAAGESFVGRYLVPPGMDKELTAAEAAAIRAAGLAILLCWELDARRAASGAAVGAKDGARAAALAHELGVPPGVTIYFAVDYAPPAGEYGAIEAYLRAAAAACRPYACGLYGPFDIVEAMAERCAAAHFWQCVGGSGGRVSPRANVYQSHWQGAPEAAALAERLGFAVDLDECADMAAAGLWLPDKPAPWYADTMAWALKEGVITEERPEDPATRAEVVQMIRNYNRRFEAEDARPVGGIITDD